MTALVSNLNLLALTLLLGIPEGRGADAVPAPAGPPQRARVVVVHEPQATTAFKANDAKVHAMVQAGIRKLTGTNDLGAAWRSLVSLQDTVGIKVNSVPGPLSGTRPAVVAAVVKELLSAGLPGRKIILWDRRLADLKRSGYVDLASELGVRVAGSSEAGWDTNHFVQCPVIGRLIWGDQEFGQKGEGLGRKSYVSSLVSTQMTRIIHITPLLNHNIAGVTGNLYGLTMDSVDNTMRFEGQPFLQARVLPEIYALPVIGDKVVLNIVDALICQYQGEETMLLHYSTALNQLRFSTDPIALDVLSLSELARQREAAQAPPVPDASELYSSATELWLGVSETERIAVEKLP